MDKIVFFHKSPPMFNIGDFLSSPRHYFLFLRTMSHAAPSTLICGGGAFNDMGLSVTRRSDARVKIAWALGRSIPFGDVAPATSQSLESEFTYLSSRDKEFCSGRINFVPCASVFNKIVDIEPDGETGLFLNASPVASGAELSQILYKHRSLVIGTNALPERVFRNAFSRTSRIVTNSYHVAYWSLLSGRSTALVGYSSKFVNLLSIFDLPLILQRYKRGDSGGLANSIELALSDKHSFVKLRNHVEYKAGFRFLNANYARALANSGIFDSVEIVEDTEGRLERREKEVSSTHCLMSIDHASRKPITI